MNREHKTYTATQAAELLGISKDRVYDSVRCGEIPGFKFGSRILVHKAKLDAMLGITDPEEFRCRS